MDAFEKYWFWANRLWRKLVTKPVKMLFCRHSDKAWHYRAFKYDSNPPYRAIRWGVERRRICLKCGKHFGHWDVVLDDLKKKKVAAIMRKLQ